jgi:hypothetical protein
MVPMTITADTLLAVRRTPTNRRIGKVRLGDLRHIHWRTQAGGTRSRFMAQPFVFGRILCTQIVEGRIAHTCQHGPPPHEVLVCMCQKDNPKELSVMLAHLANQESAVKEAMQEREAAHWLDVLDAVLAHYPLPAKLTRNKQGKGKPHRRRTKKQLRLIKARRRDKLRNKSRAKFKMAPKRSAAARAKMGAKIGPKAGRAPVLPSRLV